MHGLHFDTLPARIAVDHETRYDYDEPVEIAHHVAHLHPLQDAWQRLELFQLDVDPPRADIHASLDVWNNLRHHILHIAPHRHLVVRARSQVGLTPRLQPDDLSDGVTWEDAVQRLAYRAGSPVELASEFAVPSPMVPRSEGLRTMMAPLLAPHRSVAEVAVSLMHHIHSSFAYASGSTDIDTSIDTVLATKRGVCQDFAHLMIGALRMVGLSARYVSGYLLTRAAPGQPKLVGADASHAWVAVWCPRRRGDAIWLELDPTNDMLGGNAHVRLAMGRDFGDVTPLRGIIRGGSGHRLSVRVHTESLP